MDLIQLFATDLDGTLLGNPATTAVFTDTWNALSPDKRPLLCYNSGRLTEEIVGHPVAVVDYPKDIKAFYMRLNDDEKTVAAMDVLFPGIGEIIGGSQREERYDVLKSRIAEIGIDEKDVWWYLETRKFGTAPHSGFGLGFERMVQFISGMGNIRDVIPFPRTPGNAEF